MDYFLPRKSYMVLKFQDMQEHQLKFWLLTKYPFTENITYPCYSDKSKVNYFPEEAKFQKYLRLLCKLWLYIHVKNSKENLHFKGTY